MEPGGDAPLSMFGQALGGTRGVAAEMERHGGQVGPFDLHGHEPVVDSD